MYHGIILDLEFKDPKFINTFKVFAKRKSLDADWMLFGIEIEDNKVDETISKIQANLKDDQPFYAHLYTKNRLIVIFKHKVFDITPDVSTWKEFLKYGESLKIPKHQLQVQPTRFQDETLYFKPADFT